MRAHASTILYYALFATGIALLGLSWFLVRKKAKVRYGDARDYEAKKIGFPLGLLGMALVAFLVVQGHFVLDMMGAQIVTAILQISIFLAKVLFFCWLFVWVRWTLPRFRYDQLMQFGWKALLPLALLNLFVTAGLYLFVF